MAKYRYTMKVTQEKIADLIEAAIGRRPDELGKSGLHTWSFTFDEPDLTPAERQAALAAMPEFIRMVFGFSRDVVADEG